MSYAIRSLVNDNANVSTLQTKALINSVLATLRSSDTKILKNIQMTASAVDNTTIGLNLPSSGRFTSLTVGFPNLSSSVEWYGSNNSNLAWSGSSLSLQNSTLQLSGTNIVSSTDVALSSSTKLTLSGATLINFDTPQALFNSSTIAWSNSAAISPGSGVNSINVSDPIPYLGTKNTTTDSGLQLSSTNQQTYFLGHTASKRFDNQITDSLQYICNPNIQIDAQSKHVSSSNTSVNPTYVEFDHFSADKLYLSFEKIMLMTSATTAALISLDPTKYFSKIYCVDTVPIGQQDLQVMLPNGNDDGQVKCIQWLPAMLSNMTLSIIADTSPRLVVYGNFCTPSYLNTTSNVNGDINNVYNALVDAEQKFITINSPGSTVHLNYDTTLSAWCLMSTGNS